MRDFKKNKKLHYIVPLVMIIIFLTMLLIFPKSNTSQTVQVQTTQEESQNMPEILELKGKNLSFEELSKYFQNLSTKKGAEYAYQVLGRAELPPNTDLHLLGHIVGDELFKQKGLTGINVCTQDFRNACSHSIVIGLFKEKGDQALPEIADACKKAPGGKGAYTMCFHGLGHGILAYTEYDMEKTVHYCEKTGTVDYGYQEASQCIGGAVMEIIGGGGHDKELYDIQRPKYLKKNDPLSLCTSGLIPENAKTLCFSYITPFLIEAGGGSLGNPTPDDFKKAFRFCEGLVKENASYRIACFGSFGKEFTVIANRRDIREIENISDEGLSNVYQWCTLAQDPDGIKACIGQAVQSLYWGGENDPGVTLRFCNAIPESSYQDACANELFAATSYFTDSKEIRTRICNEIYSGIQEECKSKLLN